MVILETHIFLDSLILQTNQEKIGNIVFLVTDSRCTMYIFLTHMYMSVVENFFSEKITSRCILAMKITFMFSLLIALRDLDPTWF